MREAEVIEIGHGLAVKASVPVEYLKIMKVVGGILDYLDTVDGLSAGGAVDALERAATYLSSCQERSGRAVLFRSMFEQDTHDSSPQE